MILCPQDRRVERDEEVEDIGVKRQLEEPSITGRGEVMDKQINTPVIDCKKICCDHLNALNAMTADRSDRDRELTSISTSRRKRRLLKRFPAAPCSSPEGLAAVRQELTNVSNPPPLTSPPPHSSIATPGHHPSLSFTILHCPSFPASYSLNCERP